MKNFYLWIVAAMVCFGILPAAAQDAEASNIKFKISIAKAETVKCTMDGQEYPLKDGVNEFDLPAYTNLFFSGNAPWRITNITNKLGTAVSGFYGDSWYLYANPEIQDEEFTIEVVNIDDFRTSSFTINVDDPSLVVAMLSGYYTTLSLQPGTNTIKYDPAMETYLQLSPANYNVPLYEVKLNGTVVAPQGNFYNVELEEDCVIDITAVLPDEERTVTFSYSEGAEGSIEVKLNDQDIPDFDGKSLVVKLGDRVSIAGNFTDYKYSDVKINGESISFYGSYSFSVMKDTEVYVDAHPYGNITATLIVTLPDFITITSNGTALELKSGENIIELPENNANISWNVSSEVILNSVTVNGTPLSSYQNSYTLNDKDVVVFDIVEKVFDQEAIVWVDNVAGKACAMYLEFGSNVDRSTRYTLENGYNIISYYNAMNPFSISWYANDPENPQIQLTGKVYLNGELMSPAYENSTFYNIDLTNGDVLKLFMDAAPVECNVAFDIAEGIETNVVKDILTAVEDPAAGFDCFAGTQVTVSGTNIAVSVNGTAVDAVKDEEGTETYTFIVTDAATNVAVTSGDGSAVASIETEADSAVFNMQGVKVGSKADMKALAPGLYIVGGKKVVVTK